MLFAALIAIRIPTAKIFPSRVSGLMGLPVLSSSLQSPCTPMAAATQNPLQLLQTLTIKALTSFHKFSSLSQSRVNNTANMAPNVSGYTVYVREEYTDDVNGFRINNIIRSRLIVRIYILNFLLVNKKNQFISLFDIYSADNYIQYNGIIIWCRDGN